MKHAFLLQVHKYPEQVAEIVSLLSAPNHYFFINVDRKVNVAPFVKEINNSRGGQNVIFLGEDERFSVNHGGYSQVACTMKLLHKAHEHPDGMDYYHGISGQDYPCMSNEKFDQVFDQAGGKSFMNYDAQESHTDPKWIKKISTRVMYYHLDDSPVRYIRFRGRIVSTRLGGLWRKTLMRCFRRSELPFELNAGWSWFSWNKKVADFVLRYEQEHPQYFRRFHNTSCCDEVIFHTLLYPFREQLNLVTNDALRYIDWSFRRPRTIGGPQTLIAEDYERIIKSGAVFCRKIEPKPSKKLKIMLTREIQAS